MLYHRLSSQRTFTKEEVVQRNLKIHLKMIEEGLLICGFKKTKIKKMIKAAMKAGNLLQ